jgi:hypothetical protein
MFVALLASVSLVLSILCNSSVKNDKSQQPRTVSLCEIDVAEVIGAIELLESSSRLGTRKCIPILERLRYFSSEQLGKEAAYIGKLASGRHGLNLPKGCWKV